MNHKSAAKFLGMSRTKLFQVEKTEAGFPQRISVGKNRYFRTAELMAYINNKTPDTSPQPTVTEKVKNALNIDAMYVLNSVKTWLN